MAGRGLVTPTTRPTTPPEPVLEMGALPMPFVLPLAAVLASLPPRVCASGKAKFASSDSSFMSILRRFESSSPAFQPYS